MKAQSVAYVLTIMFMFGMCVFGIVGNIETQITCGFLAVCNMIIAFSKGE